MSGASGVRSTSITYHNPDDQEAKTRPLSMSLIRRLFRTYVLRTYRKQFWWLLTIVLIRGLQLPALIAMLDYVIRGPISNRDGKGVFWGVVGFGVLALITEFTLHFRQRLAMELGERVIHDLRHDIFNHVQQLTMSFYDKTKIGRIISRMTSDSEALRMGVQDVLFVTAVQLVQGVGAAIYMAYMNWKLFLIVAMVAPLLASIFNWFRSRLSDSYRRVQESFSRVTATLAESVTGIRVTQGFNRQDVNADMFDQLLTSHARMNMVAARTAGAFLPLLGVVTQLFMAIIVVVGGWLAINSVDPNSDPNDLITFFLFMPLFFQPCSALGNQYNTALMAMAGAERVFHLLDRKPDWEDPPDAPPLPTIEGRVDFENVIFEYEAGKPVLRSFNFTAEPGQTVALVGETGSGKSTVVNLIAKFYLTTSGSVRIDGTDVKTVSTQSLRSQLGIVLQQNFLFTGSVMDNIRIGRPQASDDQVRDAARKLDCLDLLEALPDGLYTRVGEGGKGVSLGQRQLICFTRAMLANPRILILDEATSAVDTLTEARLQKALGKLLANRTSFVVAHRLSTIRHASCVLVLRDGEVIERGVHYQLLLENGTYARLYRQFLQSGQG